MYLFTYAFTPLFTFYTASPSPQRRDKMRFAWNFELSVVKDYLSRFYSEPFACLREYVANAIAAQMRAGVYDPIYVEITPERIVVEDKGIGISKETFRDVFMWFGRSENREVEGVQGRLGLGAKSFMMLTGDRGKVIMKTRSMMTGEAYTAVLTSTGAEIIDDEGKSSHGTRFEIYLEKPLMTERRYPYDWSLGHFYRELCRRFEFSRIPIHIIVRSDEPFDVETTRNEICVAWVNEDGATKSDLKARALEAFIGIQNYEIEVIEANEVYELCRADEKTGDAVVVGDVVVKRSTWDGSNKLLRIKIEDGREVEITGVKVRAPEPLPNRDGYRGLDEFVRLITLKLRVERFREEYGRYLELSPRELAMVGETTLRELKKAIESVREGTRVSYDTYSEELLAAVERELPGFSELKRTVELLTRELPAYGAWGYVKGNGKRATVTVADVLRHQERTSKVGYTRKRPSKRKEVVMDEEGIYAVYTEDPAVIEFLEKNGVEEVKLKDTKTRIKVYTHFHTRFSGDSMEYMPLESFIHEWSGGIIIYAQKVSELKDKCLPPCKVVVGSKGLYRKLKEVFGDFVMTYDEWTEFVQNTTIVTDGYEVMTLKEATDSGKTTPNLVETTYTELIPILRRGVNSSLLTFVDVTDYTYARDIHGAKELEAWFEDWHGISPPWRNANIADRLNRKAADAICLLLAHGKDYSSIHKDLIRLAYSYTDIEMGRTHEELKEQAIPIVDKIVEKYGTLRLGKLPIEVLLRAYPDVDVPLTAEGVRLINPLLPPYTYEMANNWDVRNLYELQRRFRLFGALIHHAENNGKLTGDDGTEMYAKELVKKYLPIFTHEKNDWILLAKHAPRISKKMALAALI